MKYYFGKNDKVELTKMYGIIDYLDTIIAMYKKLKRNVKWLKMSRSFLHKYLEDQTKDASDDAVTALYNHAIKNTLVQVERKEISKIKKERVESDKYVSLENNRFLYLCSFAYNACKECTRVEHTTCELKKIFLEFDIEPLKLTTNGCPYNHNDLKENAYMTLQEDVNTGDKFRVQPGISYEHLKIIKTAPLPKEDWNYPKISLK